MTKALIPKDDALPAPAAGYTDSAKYLRHAPPPPKRSPVLDFSRMSDGELWYVARCFREWEARTLDGFGFAPGRLARIKKLMRAERPCPSPEDLAI